MRIEKMIRQTLIIGAVGILFLLSPAAVASQETDVSTELPPPEVPQPQMFCGYCHILTYPSIFQKGYETWKTGKHNKYGCIECHYPSQGVERSHKTRKQEAAGGIKLIPSNAAQRFAYIPLGGETVKTRPNIIDASCMSAKCHGKPEDKFKTKKIKFNEKVNYVHAQHLEKKNQIDGQLIQCTSCHQHVDEKKHFKVSKETCFLCHFTNVKFNEGRGKCLTCHQLPQKPIQTSGEKPITHEMLKQAKVSCSSCHIEIIQASGGGKFEIFFEGNELKTMLVLGAGRMKNESCLSCHDQTRALKEAQNKKRMHETHVSVKNARCLDCHQPILHTKADLQQPMDKQSTRVSCEACHLKPHRYQRLLSAGPKREEVSKTPDFMFKARTNCLGCHVEQKRTPKGTKVMTASGLMCVRCHTKDHDRMLKDWKSEVAKNIEEAQEVEQEALEAITEHKAKLTEDKLAKAHDMLKQGREDLHIVQFGNGVHNKKYAIMLIDAAITRFEDMLDYLEEGE